MNLGEVFVRPNGKPYRPRRPGLLAHRPWESETAAGVIILGTLDPGTAHPAAVEACHYWYEDATAGRPEPGWWRYGFWWGEPTWLDDPRRGRPGVMFTVGEGE